MRLCFVSRPRSFWSWRCKCVCVCVCVCVCEASSICGDHLDQSDVWRRRARTCGGESPAAARWAHRTSATRHPRTDAGINKTNYNTTNKYFCHVAILNNDPPYRFFCKITIVTHYIKHKSKIHPLILFHPV